MPDAGSLEVLFGFLLTTIPPPWMTRVPVPVEPTMSCCPTIQGLGWLSLGTVTVRPPSIATG